MANRRSKLEHFLATVVENSAVVHKVRKNKAKHKNLLHASVSAEQLTADSCSKALTNTASDVACEDIADGTVKLKKRKRMKETPAHCDSFPADICHSKTSDSNSTRSNDSVKKKKKKKKDRLELKATSNDSVIADEQQSQSSNSANNDATVSIRTKKRKKMQTETAESKSSVSTVDDLKSTNSDIGGSSQFHALEYLRKWKKSHSDWSFQKVRQVWLLQHMYDISKVPSEDFSILLEYLEKLVGKARQSTVDAAEKMIAASEGNEGAELQEEKFERVRQVLQMLS